MYSIMTGCSRSSPGEVCINYTRMDVPMRSTKILIALIALLTATSFATYADDWKSAIQHKLESEFALTQPTADNTDIVTAGAVVVLKAGRIMMVPVSNTNLFQNTYKDGKMTQGAVGAFTRFRQKASVIPGVSGPNAPDQRTFVPGEKMWVTKIDVKEDGVVFDLFTD